MTGEINQQDLKEFYNKGLLAFEKKNYDYAIEIFSQILSAKYDHLQARHYLHLSLKNKSEEKPLSPIAKIINPVNRLIGTLAALALIKKNNLSAGLERLEKLFSADPSDTETLKKIAEAFYEKNLFSHAIQNLEEAKSIAPKDTTILKKLGEIYLRKEDYKNAKSNYEAALGINKNDPEVLKSLKNLDALGTIKKEFGSS